MHIRSVRDSVVVFVIFWGGGGQISAPPPKAENLPASLKILNLGVYSSASSKSKCWRAPGAS